MTVNKTSFYFDFLRHSPNRQEIGELKIKELLVKFGCENDVHSIFGSFFYLTDYIKGTNFSRKFNGRKFLGYPFEEFLKKDVCFLDRLRNSEDLQIFDEQIFPDQMNFLSDHRHEANVEYSFTTNFRIRNINKTWSNVVHRTVYLFNEFYKMPVASLNWITDVTNFKNDSKINHLIEKADGINEKTVVEKRCYFLKNTQEILSKREIDVLKLASTGMGSKEIANQLNISIHTINNHRRNMLERCNCRNILQLLDIAVKNGVI